MKCYNCGCRLSEKDFCTNCGADVARYKKIIRSSNRCYNDGLERANVRDLSGAIISLRQCLKLNKNHIDARNLLGLIYFETGEVVPALTEWVISKNMRASKNVADDYLDAVQNNQSRLEMINQTVKKYNQALAYCRTDSNDLAIIQLKKVLSLNPKFIQAHQLLALLYLHTEEYDKAKRELERCIKMDINNTTTIRYMKEVEAVALETEERGGVKKNKNISSESLQYQSGNEVIIQPLNSKEPMGWSSLVNILIGAAIGLAVMWFLVLPSRIQTEKASINDELRIVSEQADAKTTTITDLESQVASLTATKEELEQELENYVGTDGKMKANDDLLVAVEAYITSPEDVNQTAEYLDQVDTQFLTTEASDAFVALYNKLFLLIGPQVSANYYETGYEAYRNADYATAIADLSISWKFDNTNGEALYSLGNSYNKNGDISEAIEIYKQVAQLFPDTEKARRSEEYIETLSTQTTE